MRLQPSRRSGLPRPAIDCHPSASGHRMGDVEEFVYEPDCRPAVKQWVRSRSSKSIIECQCSGGARSSPPLHGQAGSSRASRCCGRTVARLVDRLEDRNTTGGTQHSIDLAGRDYVLSSRPDQYRPCDDTSAPARLEWKMAIAFRQVAQTAVTIGSWSPTRYRRATTSRDTSRDHCWRRSAGALPSVRGPIPRRRRGPARHR